MSKNDITGDEIKSKSLTKEYEENYDRIFGKLHQDNLKKVFGKKLIKKGEEEALKNAQEVYKVYEGFDPSTPEEVKEYINKKLKDSLKEIHYNFKEATDE